MKYFFLLIVVPAIATLGCSSKPSESYVRTQLERHEVFAEPETWYVCLGEVYNDTLYDEVGLPYPTTGCRLSLLGRVDRAADSIGLATMESGPADAVYANECAQQHVRERSGCTAANPILSLHVLTEKGRKALQEPGSISKNDEAAFVVAHFRILRITRVYRVGPNSAVAEFQWWQQPTELGKLFEPTMGLHSHNAKALFRIDGRGQWELISPDLNGDDPHYREFSIHSEIMNALDGDKD
jgi:hypothetical protein